MDASRRNELAQTRPLQEEPAPAVGGALAQGAPTEDLPLLAGEALESRLSRAGHQRPATGAERYELRSLEGIGATSRVFCAFDRDLGREVAVKVLSRSSPGDAEEVASFIDEARITAEMQHPNVLPVYQLDAGEHGELYFSMRRIAGRSLGDLLADAACGNTDPRFVGANAHNTLVSVFIDVCQALGYAHHRGLVHQDVKPDNVMLGAFGEVLLVDWGSAARLDDPRSRIYGTPLYMSPEQARRERATPASDVFCAGASLFHALIGRPPTDADSFEAMMRRRAAGEIDPPTAAERASVPAPLLRIALKAIGADPADRYAGSDGLLRDLQAFQGGLAVSAYPEPPWRMLWRWYLRHRRACWAGLAVAAVVGALGSALVFERAKQRSDWTLIAKEDFAGASPAELERRWVGRVKTADTQGLLFHEEPLSRAEHWRLDDGKLILASDSDYVDLVWRGHLPGDFRVEWDYTPLRSNLNLDCFVGPNREDGYTFHVGTMDPRYVELTRGPLRVVCDACLLDQPLQVGRTYGFALVREGPRLALAIDGRSIVDYREDDELAALHQDSFGFDCYAQRAQAIARVRIYDRPMPELVSTLAVAQALFQNGRTEAAARQYAEIERVRAGSEAAIAAKCLGGLCLLRSDQRDQGVQQLREFAEAHREHRLAPLALVELEAQARSRGDAAERDRLRQELVRWRGHPALRRVLQGIGDELSPALAKREVKEIGGRLYPDEEPRLALDAIAGFRRWAEAYGIRPDEQRFMRDAVGLLGRLGHFEEASSVCSADSDQQVPILIAAGRYEEALRRFGYSPMVRGQALFELARYQEIIDDGALADETKAKALVAMDRFDQALARFPGTYAVSNRLLEEKRFDEYAAIYAGRDDDPRIPFISARFRLLTAKGDWLAVLGEFDHPYCRSDALIGLGRVDEALALIPDSPAVIQAVACRLIRAGERARGLDLLHRLRGRQEIGADVNSQLPLMDALLPMFEGERVDAAVALAPILARYRYLYGQRLWHIAALAAGRIDEAAFRAQPRQRGLEGDLHLALALRAEFAGDRAVAVREYRATLEAPGALSFVWPASWRAAELAGVRRPFSDPAR